jgi:hypothetical protein
MSSVTVNKKLVGHGRFNLPLTARSAVGGAR